MPLSTSECAPVILAVNSASDMDTLERGLSLVSTGAEFGSPEPTIYLFDSGGSDRGAAPYPGEYHRIALVDGCGDVPDPQLCGSPEKFQSADSSKRSGFTTIYLVPSCDGGTTPPPHEPCQGGPQHSVHARQSFDLVSFEGPGAAKYSAIHMEETTCITLPPVPPPPPPPDPCRLRTGVAAGSVSQAFITTGTPAHTPTVYAVDLCERDLPCVFADGTTTGDCGVDPLPPVCRSASGSTTDACGVDPLPPVCGEYARDMTYASDSFGAASPATAKHGDDCTTDPPCRTFDDTAIAAGTWSPPALTASDPRSYTFAGTHSSGCVPCVVVNPDNISTDVQDGDCDGVSDGQDNCPNKRNPSQGNKDGDARGDACDGDDDGDGVPDGSDNCPNHASSNTADTDHDGKGDPCDDDMDDDGVPNNQDNCPKTPNEGQEDTNGSGGGDACTNDDDGDGIPDTKDNCPGVSNGGQTDADKDGVGDACDSSVDSDGDGTDDGLDNCPGVPNSGQGDADKDGEGDACDADQDGDGASNGADNCPNDPNAGQKDTDSDGVGDHCDSDLDGDGISNSGDNCPGQANPDQTNGDSDTSGDACDDSDGDGLNDQVDNCPNTFNPGQSDLDKDGTGDACSTDNDGDGEGDTGDNCPNNYNPSQQDLDGDGIGDECDSDRDGDGTPDASDPCPGQYGDTCETNSDGDRWPDSTDRCDGTASQWNEDQDGDGEGDVCDDDRDGDGSRNESDNCPDDWNPDQADADTDEKGDACDPSSGASGPSSSAPAAGCDLRRVDATERSPAACATLADATFDERRTETRVYGRYVAPGAGIGLNCWDLQLAGGAADACRAPITQGFGGRVFAPNGRTPARATVSDDSGVPVRFSACQDLDLNDLCGEAGEPWADGCGTVDLTNAIFSPDLPTQVYIYQTHTSLGACGIATTGVVAIEYGDLQAGSHATLVNVVPNWANAAGSGSYGDAVECARECEVDGARLPGYVRASVWDASRALVTIDPPPGGWPEGTFLHRLYDRPASPGSELVALPAGGTTPVSLRIDEETCTGSDLPCRTRDAILLAVAAALAAS